MNRAPILASLALLCGCNAARQSAPTPTLTQPQTAGDFLLSASPASAVVEAGQSAPYTVLLKAKNGFSGTVALGCAHLPSGTSCTFNPPKIGPGGRSSLTVTASGPGSYTVTVSGSAAGMTHTSQVALTVGAVAPPVAPPVTGEYDGTATSNNPQQPSPVFSIALTIANTDNKMLAVANIPGIFPVGAPPGSAECFPNPFDLAGLQDGTNFALNGADPNGNGLNMAGTEDAQGNLSVKYNITGPCYIDQGTGTFTVFTTPIGPME